MRVWFFVVCGVLMLGTIVSTVADKRLSIAIAKYTFAQTELSPLTGFVMYCFIALFEHFGCTAEKSRTESADSSTKPVVSLKSARWWITAASMAVCFSLVNIFHNIGNRGSYVSGAVSVILSKIVVPLSLFLDVLLPVVMIRLCQADQPRVKFLLWRVVGIVLLLGGTALALAPLWGQSSQSEASLGTVLLCVILLLLANLPLAIGLQIYSRSMSGRLFSVPIFWASLCVCQTLIGFALIYVNSAIVGIESSAAWSNFADGFRCVFTATNPMGDTTSECQLAPILWFAACAPAGCAFNLAMGYLGRDAEGGPTLVWLLRAVALPISGVVFMSSAIMGALATGFSWWEIGGLLIVFVALVVYSGGEIREYWLMRRRRSEVQYDGKYVAVEADPTASDVAL
eukprot:TRINITY_DN14672_c0_g1_i1.p1 TRINITY_DN14672_c0_g1~~TRINITY_DN14672_c0_g1_i1.p1  ORF type:complete len:399 (+),score=82.76 TRINITY_DN14672_c0_g1_i1:136-1332(+)